LVMTMDLLLMQVIGAAGSFELSGGGGGCRAKAQCTKISLSFVEEPANREEQPLFSVCVMETQTSRE